MMSNSAGQRPQMLALNAQAFDPAALDGVIWTGQGTHMSDDAAHS